MSLGASAQTVPQGAAVSFVAAVRPANAQGVLRSEDGSVQDGAFASPALHQGQPIDHPLATLGNDWTRCCCTP